MNNDFISEMLYKSKAYEDLNKPVILTSGALGIFYVNTQRLTRDPNIEDVLNEYADNPKGMIDYAVNQMKVQPDFEEVIKILAKKAEKIFEENSEYNSYLVAGGQRRDWLFSGPVAKKLSKGHINLFKEPKGEYLSTIDSDGVEHSYSRLNNVYCVPVGDLLTEGSSLSNKEAGWIYQLRKKGIAVTDALNVVTRNQGGEQKLKELDVKPHSFVSIDEDFINQYSKNSDIALEYIKNPEEWSKSYLRKNGALEFIDDFNPNGSKFARAQKFRKRYSPVLRQSGHLTEFINKIHERYL